MLGYLGFLCAEEMSDQGQPFKDAKAWERYLLYHANGLVPNNAWEKRLLIGKTPIWFLIKSMELTFII